MLLSPEILELVLQYVDGETLLTCKEASTEFAEVIEYLTKKKHIWKKCCLKENGEKYPFDVISKFEPHKQGMNPKNWGVIYESCMIKEFLNNREVPPLYISSLRICDSMSDIQDVEIHDDLIILLVKYNQDFSRFFKIIIVNLKNVVIFESCRFNANMLYITPVEDISTLRRGAIMLPCKYCQLAAVPVFSLETSTSYPKFIRKDNFLTIEHSNGDVLWINNFKKLLTKGKCFHIGPTTSEEIDLKAQNMIKVSLENPVSHLGYPMLVISCGETRRQFTLLYDFRADVTASFWYSNLLFLGTDTGMIYIYKLSNESDMKSLNLETSYIQRYDMLIHPISAINVMELSNEFVIIACTKRSLTHLHIKRELKNFS